MKISNIDWAGYASMVDSLSKVEWLNRYGGFGAHLHLNTIPDLLKLVSQLDLVRTAEGLVSFEQSTESWMDQVNREEVRFSDGKPVTKAQLKGILRYLRCSARSTILPGSYKQSEGAGLAYNASAPLILLAFKLHEKVPYNAWDWNEDYDIRQRVLDKHTLDYSEDFGKPELLTKWSLDELQMFREAAMLNAKKGVTRTPLATTSVTKVHDPEFTKLSKYAQMALLQLWVFHPSAYHKNSIVNMLDLDAPAPVVFPEDVEDNVFGGDKVEKRREPIDDRF